MYFYSNSVGILLTTGETVYLFQDHYITRGINDQPYLVDNQSKDIESWESNPELKFYEAYQINVDAKGE